MSNEIEPIMATMADLRPQMKNVTVSFKVIEMSEEREVTSRHDGATHRIMDAVVGDTTGIVSIPLWDTSIDSVEVGKSYTLTNGYTGLFRRNLRLNIGKYGELSDSEEAFETVDTTNDMSAKEH